jgi:hypothetical protein
LNSALLNIYDIQGSARTLRTKGASAQKRAQGKAYKKLFFKERIAFSFFFYLHKR